MNHDIAFGHFKRRLSWRQIAWGRVLGVVVLIALSTPTRASSERQPAAETITVASRPQNTPASDEPQDQIVVRDPTCLVEVPQSCMLKTTYQGFEVQITGARGLVLYFYGPARVPVSPQESTVSSNKGPEPVVVVEEDLRRSEAKNGLTQDAADRILSELTILDGAVYEIPDFALLKHELGFPAGTTFRADDLKELLLSHLQFTLGIGPVTASYLSGRLGVSAQPMATKVDPNAIDEDGTLFVMFKESGASGAESGGRGIKSPSASDTSLDLPQMDGEDTLVNEEPRLRSVEW